MRLQRIPVTVLSLLWLSPVAGAQQMYSLIEDDEKSIVYAPCAGEEIAECITHIFDCRGDGGFGDGLDLLIVGQGSDGAPDIRKLATALISKPLNESTVTFNIAGKTVASTVGAVTVSNNELNGDLDLAIHLSDDDGFFEGLVPGTATDVKADVAGEMVALGFDKASGEALMKFKQACMQ